jgi:putative pyruvate formate lyase activating enzyme
MTSTGRPPSEAKLAVVRAANAKLNDALKCCRICPRRCGVDRTAGKAGYCRAFQNPVVYSYAPHRGEEPPISGRNGSGTIFFSGCSMKCAYCQNYQFSQLGHGKEMSVPELAACMLFLEKKGCHNINLVSPTHYLPQILLALEIALGEWLIIPLVYNTSGYELTDTIKLLEGIVDIYLPDMRYADERMAARYSDAPDYVKYDRDSVMLMHNQVGNLVLDENGIAVKGLIIRLLVMPDGISATEESLRYVRDKISPDVYLSIMSQYYPTYRAMEFKELSRGVTSREYKNVIDTARRLGLNNGWIQEEPDARLLGTNIKPQKEIG